MVYYPYKTIGTTLLEEVALQPRVVAVMARKWEKFHSYQNKIPKLLTSTDWEKCKMRGECCHLLRSICNKKMISSLFCNGANKQANVFKKVFDEARLLRTLKYFE